MVLQKKTKFRDNMSTQENTLHFIKQLVTRHVSECADEIETPNPALIDSALFDHLVFEHRLEFIVSSKKNAAYIAHLPVYPKIQKRCYQKIKRHLEMQQCLLELNQALNTQDILHAVLKGLPLNAQLYGESCFRTSNDIDILIHEKDLLAAHQCFINLGFELQYPIPPQQIIKHSPFLFELQKDFVYTHPLRSFRIELHWQLTDLPDLHFEPLNKNHIIYHELSKQRPIPVLAHSIQFLYLCTHAALHAWQRMQWLIDIAVYYQKIPLDWSEVILLAHKYSVIRPLLEAAYLLKAEYRILLPDIPHSQRDDLSTRFRLRYTQKLWQNPVLRKYLGVFYATFLYARLGSIGRHITALILKAPGSMQQLMREPRCSRLKLMGCSLYVKLRKEFRKLTEA